MVSSRAAAPIDVVRRGVAAMRSESTFRSLAPLGSAELVAAARRWWRRAVVPPLLGFGGVAQAPAPPEGVWQSEGYGVVWEFDRDRLMTYEITTATCLRATGYRRAAAVSSAGELVFRADTAIGAVAADWVLRPGRSATRMVAHTPGTAADVGFRRLERLPDRCRTEPAKDRAATFELFRLTMAEQYAFFRERGVDWAATVAAARPQAAAAADDRAFYRVLAEMVAPLHDRHTDVTATSLGLRQRNGRAVPDPLPPEEVLRLRSAPPAHPLVDSLIRLHDDRIQFGRLTPTIGYLKVTAVYGFRPTGRFEDDSIAFDEALETVFSAIAGLPGLVLDLRINGGGYDALAKLLAGRLTSRPYLGFTKQARADPGDPTRFTPLSRVVVSPAGRHRFGGRLAVLLGPNTLSAGEVLAMMLRGRRPRPLFVGEPTQGIFADELVRRLPNGWRFQLSNERYAMPNGEVYEGRGVPVDLALAVFPEADRVAGRDRMLEAAVRWLAGGTTILP